MGVSNHVCGSVDLYVPCSLSVVFSRVLFLTSAWEGTLTKPGDFMLIMQRTLKVKEDEIDGDDKSVLEYSIVVSIISKL